MREQEQETQQITPEDCGSVEEILGVDESEACYAKDILRFDVGMPLASPGSPDDVDVRALADQIREAIVAIIESETRWKLESHEVLKAGDGTEYEAPIRLERIDFNEALAEEENT